jgi:D-glycero-alpha-D-manno-heptose-7-phosphate kinase
MRERFYNFSVSNRGITHTKASAPTRIDLAGGTIDIWPLYLEHDGACTVNAAISLRAHADVEARSDGRVELRSIDTHRQQSAARWQDLDPRGDLPLLALLARHYGLTNATLTTRGESPAGAGIAGSSALAIAVCGALARFTGASMDAALMLQTAMNVECQTIRVPTGVQDYRPALHGGVAAIELRTDVIRRVPIDVSPRELERRIVLAYTGAPRNSGTNNWEITKRHIDGDPHIFDCFERIRDTAVAMRQALVRGDWDEVGRQIATEWDNRKRLAPGVSTPKIDSLIARAQAAGATAAKVCGAGGGGCLFCYGPPDKRDAIEGALSTGEAQVLDFTIESDGLRFDERS